MIALLAVAVMVTRTDMELLALRAMFDLPFYVIVLRRGPARAAAAALRGGRCCALLGLAGCCAPRRGCWPACYWL